MATWLWWTAMDITTQFLSETQPCRFENASRSSRQKELMSVGSRCQKSSPVDCWVSLETGAFLWPVTENISSFYLIIDYVLFIYLCIIEWPLQWLTLYLDYIYLFIYVLLSDRFSDLHCIYTVFTYLFIYVLLSDRFSDLHCIYLLLSDRFSDFHCIYTAFIYLCIIEWPLPWLSLYVHCIYTAFI